MALRRDDADAIQYAALKHERHQVTQEIARLTSNNFERDVHRLSAKVEAIERRMRALRARSLLKLE